MHTFLPFPSFVLRVTPLACAVALSWAAAPSLARADGTSDSLSEADILSTVRMHQQTVRQRCWEPRKATIGTTSVHTAIRITADGSVENVEASGDSDAMVDCVSRQVQTWRFPQTKKPSTIHVPFKFVVQR